MENNELYHHGINGQKWGIRRYQNEDGSLTDEGRRHYGYGVRRIKEAVESAKKKHHAKVIAKKRQKSLEAARKARAEKAAHERDKKRAMEVGSAEEVLKYKNELSTEEKNKIYQRLQSDENLARLAENDSKRRAEEAEKKSKWNKIGRGVKKMSSALNTAGEAFEKMTRAYNAGAKIYNAFSDSKLPIVGEKAEKSAREMFGRSMDLTEDILKKSGDKSIEELKTELERAETIQKLEKIASGQTSGKKK